ncbi:MAG TPA: TonB-dependent receptor plug domain-containing protein, partial [Verrucomicrobiae bacterium]|nr:TonB-dependent receptor plug domain-containing protein [Verrucomicrobiae bacterium]
QDILTLTPGVTDTDGDGNPNVQGARATGLQIRLDGGNITDPVSGTFGQNLNLDAVEEIEVITSGASAEFGRADGGFANIITKSGGNDFEGSFKLFWQGRFLNGNGATGNNDTQFTRNQPQGDLRRLSPFITGGGALKKDKVWYFATIEYIHQANAVSLGGSSFETSNEGHNAFGKITWQVNSDNKLALQYNDDPRTFRGGFLGFGVDADSDATFVQGARTPQLRWTSIISPTLLLETLLTHFDSGISIVPVSNLFSTADVSTIVNRQGNSVSLQALYPVKQCSDRSGSFIQNCDPSQGKLSMFQIDLLNGTTTGPFPVRTDDSRKRDSIKADLSYTVEDAWGEHQIKSGMEFAEESFSDSPITNPVLTDLLQACPECRDQNGQPIPNAVKGFQTLIVSQPTVVDQRATSFNSAAYITDTWKPKQNLSVQLGMRFDREDIDSSGFTAFNPRTERRKSIGIVNQLCADAQRVFAAGGTSNSGSTCVLNSNFEPSGPLRYTMDALTPEAVRKFDVDLDGTFDSGKDGPVWTNPYTTFPDRLPENFEIKNLNVSPRLSVSWDPMADGKTKVFGTWGRFYDRLFLSTVLPEVGPDTVGFLFQPDPSAHVLKEDTVSQRTSAVSVTQVDRGLKTPFTDTFTVGFEREIAPEWSTKVTYTQRLGWDLVQDTDINHALCTQYGALFGISPQSICPLFTKTLPNGKQKVVLSDDLFGSLGTKSPNVAPDLYNVNQNFNQVLRIGNSNASQFHSVALEVVKRLHRNWQMNASYTYSVSKGNAEAFQSPLGNDPATIDKERGYLAFDQRHRVVVIATSHLPKDVEIGATVSWEGGTPYSILAQVSDEDNIGNVNQRVFFPSGRRNDQRNGNFWNLDTQITKRFHIGKVQASAQFAVKNVLNMDDETLASYRISSFNGLELGPGPLGLRRFGRFWEIGTSFNF